MQLWSVYLSFSGQHPFKHALDVGLDVLGVLAARNDCDPSLHIPLQAHLHRELAVRQPKLSSGCT